MFFSAFYPELFVGRLPTLACMLLHSLSSRSKHQEHQFLLRIRFLKFQNVLSFLLSFIYVLNFLKLEQYRWIAYISIAIGCCFVGVFHLGTQEPRFVMYSNLYLAI